MDTPAMTCRACGAVIPVAPEDVSGGYCRSPECEASRASARQLAVQAIQKLLSFEAFQQHPEVIQSRPDDGDMSVTIQPEGSDHPVTLELHILSAAVIPIRPRRKRTQHLADRALARGELLKETESYVVCALPAGADEDYAHILIPGFSALLPFEEQYALFLWKDGFGIGVSEHSETHELEKSGIQVVPVSIGRRRGFLMHQADALSYSPS